MTMRKIRSSGAGEDKRRNGAYTAGQVGYKKNAGGELTSGADGASERQELGVNGLDSLRAKTSACVAANQKKTKRWGMTGFQQWSGRRIQGETVSQKTAGIPGSKVFVARSNGYRQC